MDALPRPKRRPLPPDLFSYICIPLSIPHERSQAHPAPPFELEERAPRTYIIAEAGVNHNGDVERALDLVRVAAEAGADAVKFQTFRAKDLVTDTAAKAAYQTASTGAGSQVEMLQALELGQDHFERICACCADAGIEFLSTPFDAESLRFLLGSLHMKRVKVSSGDLTHGPLLLEVAQAGVPVILSTGMSWLGEVEEALGVLAFGMTPRGERARPSRDAFCRALVDPERQQQLRERVTVLQCTTQYPTPDEAVHLRAMDTLRAAFGLPVGFSDHSSGIAIPLAAVARGAQVLEKHFTLDRSLEGPDHAASLEPDELAEMVRSVRRVEKSLGRPEKRPDPAEIDNRAIARRALVASRALRAGETFGEDMIAVKRAGEGVSPLHYWAYLGTRVGRDYDAGEVLDAAQGAWQGE